MSKHENVRTYESFMRSRIGLYETNDKKRRAHQAKLIEKQLAKIEAAKADYENYLKSTESEQK